MEKILAENITFQNEETIILILKCGDKKAFVQVTYC